MLGKTVASKENGLEPSKGSGLSGVCEACYGDI